MNNAELIKALRCEVDCGDCAYFRGHSCDIWGMMCDAADALEAADEQIAELSLDCEMFQQMCMELGAQLQTVKDCHTLEEGER